MKKEENRQKGKTSKKMKTSNLQNRIIIYIILIFIALYILYTIYLLIRQPTNVFMIEEGKLYQEETVLGYIIRDEVVVKGNNYKNGIEQIKSEGEKTAKNEDIFRYYSSNEENLKKKISELDGKIQEVMTNDTSLLPKDIKLLENQIDEKIEDICKIKDTSKLIEYKKEIDNLVSKKAKEAGEASPKGSYLKQLIEERKNYESQLNSGAEYVKAPMSGIVSYKVDGLEEVLAPNSFETLTQEYLDKLNLKTGKLVATNEECGKVIDNFYCYIVAVSNSEQAKNAEIGKNIKVRLSNSVEVPAEITNIIREEGKDDVLIIVRLRKEIQELINYRKISCELIWWSDSGLKVPNQAIVNENGLDYVVRNRAGYLSKMLIKVERRGENYSIIDIYDTDELKELGFSTEEIISYKKVSLYDEILINPDLSRVK